MFYSMVYKFLHKRVAGFQPTLCPAYGTSYRITIINVTVLKIRIAFNFNNGITFGATKFFKIVFNNFH